MKKLTAFILVCVLLLGTAMPIAAADAGSAVQPRYTYIMDISAGIQVSGWGVASCTGVLNAKIYTPVKITIALQRLDGITWTTIKQWEVTGTGSVSATKNYAIYSGYSYCVYVTGYIYDANGNCLEYTSAIQYIDY
ncbi:MAG: hypothetical protein ACI3W5_01210 [Faecousia sp.]